MRKRNNANVGLKYCETVFTFIVIAACVITIYSTVTSSRGGKSPGVGARHDALHNAKESFNRMMMKFSRLASAQSSTLDPRSIEEPDTGLYFDNFREWFAKRNVTKFESSKKHPNIQKLLINNKDICRNVSTVDILIYYHSKWDNFDKRSLLRETWANVNVFHDITIRALFILGKSSMPSDQIKVKNENLVHHDIIQGDFIDSFSNITYKSVLALNWINENCLNARYIIKADDDMFVNIFAVIEYLITQIHEKKRIIMCQVKEDGTSPIIRDSRSKWYIPKEIFAGKTHFPTFCSGYMTLFTTDLVPELYKFSFEAPYFSVDDVYLFGYLLSQLKDVQYEDISNSLTLNLKSGMDEYQSDGPLIHVGVSAWEKGAMEKLWTLTLNKMSEWTKKHAKIVLIKQNVTIAMSEQ